jgi:glycosyltransferase involved in cell wall biosynthesis
MSELLGIPIKIHALWHAGSYDPQDFLGRLIGNAPWVRHSEMAFFHAIDYNYFATNFHIDMFLYNLLDLGRIADKEIVDEMFSTNKIVRSGWPMEYMSTEIVPFQTKKRDLILFPHRLAPEKQVEIFRDLATALPEYKFIVCQDQELTKEEYHTLLGQSKIVFSANLQETLGISCYEGMLVGAIPMVPDRLSYKEMYDSLFKYPSEWTESWNSYHDHKEDLKARIREHMENFDTRHDFIRSNAEHLTLEFFSATNILETISGKSLRED